MGTSPGGGEIDGFNDGADSPCEHRGQHPAYLGGRAVYRQDRRWSRPRPPAEQQRPHHGERFLIAQHERRHAVVRSQPVAAVPAARPVDRNIQVPQVLDVAANGALVDGEPLGQVGDGVRAAGLQQFEHRQHGT